MVMGIALGPVAANFLNSEKWGSAVEGQTNEITLVRVPRSSLSYVPG
jgi:prolipoprotein diacylglyceryltransferase